ncbi:hypothetical protein KIL84_003270, partial [Mauremys mutica]
STDPYDGIQPELPRKQNHSCPSIKPINIYLWTCILEERKPMDFADVTIFGKKGISLSNAGKRLSKH